jgi:sugar O-acyltransferase (sialic acid O-acetyltransferase NeuD family)
MQRLLVIGAGGHGRSVAEAALASGAYHLTGFLDDAYPSLSTVLGFPVQGTSADLAVLGDGIDAGIVAIGNAALRERLFVQLGLSGLARVTVIHPSAVVSPSTVIGAGCTIMAGAIIGTEARLGDGVIVNCGAVVDHHCQVEDFCHLGVKAAMAGGAVLRRGAWLQAGATLGYGAVVDVGAVVASGEVVCGC